VAGSLAEIRGLSCTLSGLGLVADAGTIVSPQDKGAMGWADRGVALGNGGLITARAALRGAASRSRNARLTAADVAP
jgi:hypothetical protein